MYNPHDIVSVGKGMFCLTGTYTLQNKEHTVYSHFMPVCTCSTVKTIIPRCRGPPDALLHEAFDNSLTILQTCMKQLFNYPFDEILCSVP